LLIEPSALLYVVVLSAMIQFGVAPRMTAAFFVLELLAIGSLFHAMHWKRRDTSHSYA
jgi:hypothetical protein